MSRSGKVLAGALCAEATVTLCRSPPGRPGSLTGPAHLNPVTVIAMWAVCGLAMGWANYHSIREAWIQASARNERKTWRFLLSFVGREQVAYAKRIPVLLLILLVCCGVAYLIPGS